MTKPVPPKDEDFLFRRYLERSRNARTIKDYRALGYAKKGAAWMVEQDAEEAAEAPQDQAVWGLADADFPPFPPFPIGNRATAYEWMMVYSDREPYAPWFGVDGETPDDADARLRLMLTFAEEPTLNLCAGIRDGRIPLEKEAYRRDRLGNTVLDITRCVFSQEAMLDFARRIGGYGAKIADLLATTRAKEDAAVVVPSSVQPEIMRTGSEDPIDDGQPMRRGRPPVRRHRVEVAITNAIASGKYTIDMLCKEKQEAIAATFLTNRATLQRALKSIQLKDAQKSPK